MSLIEKEVGANRLLQFTNATILKKQVNIIRLSKFIKDPLELAEKTGVSMLTIRFVLENQNNILEEWKKCLKSKSDHADDCDAIDILILEWVKRCKLHKMKLTSLAVKAQIINVTQRLNISPYCIKATVWSLIEQMLEDNSSVVVAEDTIKNHGLLQLLKTDGSRLLKPKIYQKFLQTIGNGSQTSEKSTTLNAEHAKPYAVGTRTKCHKAIFISTLDQKNELQTAAVTVDLTASMATNLSSKNKYMMESTIDVDRLENANDKSHTLTSIRPALRKGEKKDYERDNLIDFEELIDIFDIEDFSRINANGCLSAPSVRSNAEDIPVIIQDEIRDQSDLIVSDETDLINTIGSDYNDQETLVDLSNIINFTKKFEEILENPKDSNELTETKLNNTSCMDTVKNAASGNKDDDDVRQIVYELEDSDEDIEQEPMERVHKYPGANSNQKNLPKPHTDVRLKTFKENATDNEAVMTVVEISSDDEEAVSESRLKTKALAERDNAASRRKIYARHRKRIHPLNDKQPSTSKSATSFHHSTSPKPTKKPCLRKEMSDLTNLTVKSSIQAFKYLYCIKKFFDSQSDKEAAKIIKELMKAFLINRDTIEKKSS